MQRAAPGTEASRLARLREALGLSQRQMAREFGVSSGAIAHWESGTRVVPGPVQKLIEVYEEQLAQAPRSLDGAPPVAFPLREAYALGALVDFGLHRVFSNLERSRVAKRVRLAAIRRYARALGELRGASMKLGQMVTYMSFLMPEDERELLAESLQPPHPMTPAQIARVFVEDLGVTPREAFAFWDPEPIATASIGQVHRASLPGGRPVAVKVQYPKIVEALRADLKSLWLLDRVYSLIFRGQAPGVFHREMQARLLEECDYRIEAAHQRSFQLAFVDAPDIVVPEVVEALSGSRVLTMDLAIGLTFDELVQKGSQRDRDRAGSTLWRFFHEGIFRHELFQTDPNPGNYLFAEERVVFLDFGRIKRFSPGFVPRWKRVIRAVLERNRSELLAASIAIGSVSHPGAFDEQYSYKTLVLCFLPWLVDEPFEFHPRYVQETWRACVIDNRNLPALHVTADMSFLHQLTFGLAAVLARLGARVRCRSPMLDFLYASGEARPPAFTVSELEAIGIDSSLARR